jgi:hypothetical protein
MPLRNENFRNRDGVRQMKRDMRDAAKRVTHGEFDAEMQKIGSALRPYGAAINGLKIRIEALLKTLLDARVLDEAKFDANVAGIRAAQDFIAGLHARDLPMSDRVRATIEFNAGQAEDFRINDRYFPIRQWLVAERELDPELMFAALESFGFSPAEVDQILVERQAVAAVREANSPQPEGQKEGAN